LQARVSGSKEAGSGKPFFDFDAVEPAQPASDWQSIAQLDHRLRQYVQDMRCTRELAPGCISDRRVVMIPTALTVVNPDRSCRPELRWPHRH
jgi:hypothetical protein